MWDLPGPVPGFEPVSPAWAGGFLTTAPPRKPLTFFFVLTFNLRTVKTYWKTLPWLSQPSVIKLLPCPPPKSPTSLPPIHSSPLAFFLSLKHSLAISRSLYSLFPLPGTFFPQVIFCPLALFYSLHGTFFPRFEILLCLYTRRCLSPVARM